MSTESRFRKHFYVPFYHEGYARIDTWLSTHVFSTLEELDHFLKVGAKGKCAFSEKSDALAFGKALFPEAIIEKERILKRLSEFEKEESFNVSHYVVNSSPISYNTIEFVLEGMLFTFFIGDQVDMKTLNENLEWE